MNRTTNLTMVLLVALGGLLAVVISWFLLISPRLGAAAEADASRATQIEANAALETQVAALKVEFDSLPALRETLWEYRDQFPATQDVASMRELLHQIATDNGLAIASDTFSAPQVLAPGLILGPAYAAIGQESYVDTLVFENLIETTVTISATGPLDQILGFLDDVQMGDHRYILVSAFTLTPVSEDLAANPPIPAGSAELTITGKIYTLDYGNPDAILRPPADPMPGDFLLPSEDAPLPPRGQRDIFLPAG